jgi:hypothetical protein
MFDLISFIVIVVIASRISWKKSMNVDNIIMIHMKREEFVSLSGTHNRFLTEIKSLLSSTEQKLKYFSLFIQSFQTIIQVF